MPTFVEPLNLGDLLKYEAPNLYSRDRIRPEPAAGYGAGQIDPSAEDGTQVAAAVLLQACDATLSDRNDGLVVARHAIVADHALAWPDAITNAEKLAAVAQLKALGVLVRQGA